MAKRRISKLKYFHGDVELEAATVGNRTISEIEASLREPPGFGDKLNGPRALAGHIQRGTGPITWDHLRWFTVDRTVKYLAKANPHQCDWRCEGAKPGGECWCSCEGRNHGRRWRAE